MAITDQIIVEIIADTSQLEPAIKTLENTGAIDAKLANGFKQTTAEINKQVQAVRTLNVPFAPLKKNLDDVAKQFKQTTAFVEGFAQGVLDALNESGVTMEEFLNGLKKGPKEAEAPVESLKARLRNLTNAIAEAKLAGQENTQAFHAMVVEAGRLKDAMLDASQEVKTFSSDSRAFDVVAGSISAVASGFAAAQGAQALFGADSEDLQKTLVKVNAAMAIAQGLQQITNALQEEGAINQARLLVLQKASLANQALENAQQSTSIIVRTGAAAAQRLLNAAMTANPIGIFVVALTTLVALLATYGRAAVTAREQTTKLNVELGKGAENFREREQAIENLTKNTVDNLQLEGKTASEVTKAELDGLDLRADARKQRLDQLRDLQAKSDKADIEEKQKLNDEIARLENQQTDDAVERNHVLSKIQKQQTEEALKDRVAQINAELAVVQQGGSKQLALQKALVDAEAQLALNADGLLEGQRREIENKARQQRLELETEFQKRRIELQLKSIETQLVNAEAGSKEEFVLKTRQLQLQTAAELENTKLSQKEKEAIISLSLANQLKLQKDFNEAQRREAIQGQIDLNTAAIDNLKTSNEDKLALQIDNINLAAQIEIDAARNNGSKIKEIIAKREADIIEVKKAAIETALKFELDMDAAREGANLRTLNRIAADEKLKAKVRIAAVNDLVVAELDGVDKRIAALQEEKDKKLLNDNDYNLQYQKLLDDKAKITEDGEKKVTDIVISENAKRKAKNQEYVQTAIDTFRQIGDLLDQVNQQKAQRDQARIDQEKAQLQDLVDAGAITEKEAKLRAVRIDNEEKKIKAQAAQRDKALAIFNAVINTAQAITKALASAPPPLNAILAAIAAALGAAQIAIIANRPIPKFRYGKKNMYSGLGEIGEAGTEILERNKQMYIVDRPRIVWLNREDKVYNPAETKRIMQDVTPHVDKSVMSYNNNQKARNEDYDKIGQAVAKEIKKIPGVNISVDEDGFHFGVRRAQQYLNYMDRRYSSKT